MNHRRFLFVFIILAIIITGGSLLALNLSSGPTIAPVGENEPSTTTGINCSWNPSGDTTAQNVSWFRNTVLHTGPISVAVGTDTHALSPGVPQKSDSWICQVTLSNGSSMQSFNSSAVIIKNAPPNPPNASNRTLYEDQSSATTIKATDPDGDSVSYLQPVSDDFDPFYCSIGSSTGLLSCTPSATHVGHTNVTFVVKDSGNLISGSVVGFTVIEVNDPPIFSLSDQSATEDTLFNYTFAISDEESHTPFNISLSSNFTGNILSVAFSSATDAYITFNRPDNAPDFIDVGTWEVNVTVNDSGPTSDTPYDDHTSTQTFILTVASTNHPPNITTNLSSPRITGTQGVLLTFDVNATDIDIGDSLSYTISSNCSLPNPWSISTISSDPSSGLGRVSLTLNNSHIACPWVTVSVSDGSESTSQTAWLNLTNTNDAPVIYEQSFYGANSATNMSNLSTIKGEQFSFRVNATDIDLLTYESEVLTFSDNSSLFSINASTGTFSFIANDSHVGSHTILVNVSDDEGLWASRIMFLEVQNNTVPVLDPIGNFSCDQNTLCTRYITAFDPDPGEDLVFLSNDTSVFNLSDHNETAWLLNFIPTNDMVGSYIINVSVTDQYGFSDEEIFTFNITNVNDAPFFDNDKDGVADNISFDPVIVDRELFVYLNATDIDLLLTGSTENLTFNFSFTIDPFGLSSNATIEKLSVDEALFSLTPNGSQNGSYQVNLSVTDAAGAVDWELIDFAVLPKTNPPNITHVRPYKNESTNITVNSFVSINYFSANMSSLNASEGDTILFDVLATNDTGIVGNHLSVEWYVDDSLLSSKNIIVTGSNSSFTHTFDYFSSGMREIHVVVTDARYSTAQWSWNVTVADVNRPVTFSNPLLNVSLDGSTTLTDYFAYRVSNVSGWLQRFYDPDDDLDSDGRRASVTGESTALTYALAPNESCSVVSMSFSADSLSLRPETIGTCIVTFRATDPYGSYVDSNEVWITVTNIDVEQVQVPVSTSGGGGSSSTRPTPIPIDNPVDVPVPLELIVPEAVFTYENDTVEVPFTLQNNWTEALVDVYLNATTKNDSLNLSFRFSDDYFPFMDIGEKANLTLYIENYREEGPFMVTIFATVDDPEYVDKASVMISSLERRDSGESVENKVVFARDLLNDNPECQELNELLVKAEEERLKKNYEEAIKLVTTVVNGCKYLVNVEKEVVAEQPKDFFSVAALTSRNLPALIVGLIIIIAMFVFGILMIVTSRRRKGDMNF